MEFEGLGAFPAEVGDGNNVSWREGPVVGISSPRRAPGPTRSVRFYGRRLCPFNIFKEGDEKGKSLYGLIAGQREGKGVKKKT